MYRNQLKFFRHMGIVPKVPTNSVGVSADFPLLPESLPPREFLKKGEEYFVGLPSCKILKPSTSGNSASEKCTNTEESKPKIKVECFDVPSD
ncbi:hypothetical protein TNCT_650672 [Trichonephila clavata]|nr:hypothetical protein TNCT_650672 [Trichonephila clavata]